jgi:hypothetical protein
MGAMSVPTYSELVNLMLDRTGANVAVDGPLSATEQARFLNQGLLDVWEISGGSLKKVTSAAAWSNAENAAGYVPGLLTDVDEVRQIFATSTAPQALACVTTITSATVTSAALFGTVLAGMAVSGAGIPTGAYVLSKTNSSTIILSEAATASANPVTLTFSPVGSQGDTALEQVELPVIQHLRSASGYGSYAVPRVVAVTRLATVTPSNVGKLELHYWPGVTGVYFPMHYVPMFTPIDSATITTPDMSDIDAWDGGLIAAARVAQAIGREDRVGGILRDVSQRTAAALKRKFEAMLAGKQDDVAA